MWRKIRIDLGSQKKRLRVLILSSVHTLKQNSPLPRKIKTFFCNDKKKCPIIEEIDSDDDFRAGCRSVNAITVLLSTILSGTIVLHRLMICLLLEFKPFTVKENKYIT